MRRLGVLLIAVFLLVGCHSPRPGELHGKPEAILPLNTNLEVVSDSLLLEFLPVKDAYVVLHKGDRVVVAEFTESETDSSRVEWIKVAHSQQKQGWITTTMLANDFVPTDSISQFIYFFSHSSLKWFIGLGALLVALFYLYFSSRKRMYFVFINDVDSLFPAFLCFMVALSATLYQSIQMFAPGMWQHYYYSTSLSPVGQPVLVGTFLCCLWATLVVFLASVDVCFRQLSSGRAVVYLLGLIPACILFYAFFIITTTYYIGYLFLAAFAFYLIYKLIQAIRFRYRCGYCGQRMKQRGVCPSCGVLNR